MKMLLKPEKSGNNGARRITLIAFLVCLSLVAGLIESIFPPLIPMAPGAKLGLGNIAPLLALLILGVGDAFAVMLAKCLLQALISGGVSGLMYSVPAGVVALGAETALVFFALGTLSVAMISLVGAVVFNVVQLGVATLVTGVNLITLLPLLAAAGVLAGAFTGLLVHTVIRSVPYSVFRRYGG